MKTPRKILCLLVTCVLMLFALVGSGTTQVQNNGKQEKDRGKDVQKYIYPLLKKPLFVDLNWNQPVFWKANEFPSVPLPDESPNHAEGVFWMHDMRANVYKVDHPLMGVYGTSEIRVLRPQNNFFAAPELQQRALQFLREASPWFFAQGPLPTPTIKEPGHDGIWHFEWQRYRADELPDTEIGAEVRAIDGKVVSFGSSKLIGEWEHKITPTQAKQKAQQIASEVRGLTNIQVGRWSIGGGGGTRYYNIKLKARNEKTGQMLYSDMQINAMTGDVTQNSHGWQPAERDRPSRFIVNDRLPVWTKQGLVFTSDRALEGMPAWAVVPSQLFLQDQAGMVFSLTSDLKSSTPSSASSLPNSSWLGFERHGWTYALDLVSGNYRVLGHPERRGALPAINSDGSWAVTMGKGHTGNAEFDLFADNLSRGPQLGLRGRLAMPYGDEHHPIFSPNGDWLYFVTSRKEKGQLSHALRRISTAIALNKEIKNITQEQAQTIATLTEDVVRMSIFPDGGRILLQNLKGIFIVSILHGEISRALTQKLHDTELGLPIEEIRDGWAGPTNDRITFSGKTVDSEGNIRWRIYSCHLDGKKLQIYTSKINESVSMYKFPENSKTAYNLAKEWALHEIAWKATPDHINQ